VKLPMHLSTSYHQSALHPASIILDCNQFSEKKLKQAIALKLESERAVYLRNTGMTALPEMSNWAEFVGIQQMDYEGGTGSRFEMGAGVLSVGTEPGHTNIDPHSEMAYWHYYPRFIMFGCEVAPQSGGETVIASNQRVTETLENTTTGRKIFETGIRYIRNYSDRNNPDSIASTASWQESFNCEIWEELEPQCVAHDWQLERKAGGSAKISWLEQGFEFDEKTDKHLLFTSMARLGRAFDDWPPYNNLDNEDRPYHVTYADGSPFTDRDLSNMDNAYARNTIPIKWQPGDIAVLENIAWTHSRPPYHLKPGEQRKIGILVSNHTPRLRQQVLK
jgi:alpha-ketoglutarate-dependent taurine dioxygenase